jgi:two-component system, cell cycle response regulator
MNNYESKLCILIVDDDPISRAILQEHLGACGHEVICADSTAQAMYILEKQIVQIVIADWIMPGLSGLDLCKWIRSRQWSQRVHIAMLTILDEPDRLVEAFEAGVDDFLSKPFDEAELLARLRAWMRLVNMQQELIERNQEAARLTTELIAVNKKLAELAAIDDLTGLGNRRQAIQRIEEHLALARRYGHPFTCALIDIDQFKRFNDTYGHGTGDRILKHLGNVLNQTIRHVDFVFRMGGDEFLVLLPQISVQEAVKWTERCQAALKAQPLQIESGPVFLTISIGIAEYTPAADTLDELLEIADNALYAAKESGRNTSRIGSPVSTAEAVHTGSPR